MIPIFKLYLTGVYSTEFHVITALLIADILPVVKFRTILNGIYAAELSAFGINWDAKNCLLAGIVSLTTPVLYISIVHPSAVNTDVTFLHSVIVSTSLSTSSIDVGTCISNV